MAATSPFPIRWRKSSRSNGGEDSCVEVAALSRPEDTGISGERPQNQATKADA